MKTHKEKLAEEEKAKKDAEDAANADDDEEDESEKSSDEERPAGIVQPKYKIVHSYPQDIIMDSWQGHQGTLEAAQLEQSKKKLPDSLTVTIFAKHVESMK